MLSKPLIIDSWTGGMADSHYQGVKGSHYAMVGLDFRTEPGISQLAYKMTATASSIRSRIRWFLGSTDTETYAIGELSDSPHIHKSTNSGQTWSQVYTTNHLSTGIAQGAIIWRGAIFIAGNSKLDVYNHTAGSDAIGWQTIDSDADYHPMLESKGDGALYIGCGRYLAKISETSGQHFMPYNSGTYTFTAQALDLPPDFRIKSIEEIGSYLILGCWKRNDAGKTLPVAVIYPWNHILISDSHEGPINLRRRGGVSALLNINSKIFAWVGIRGEIFYYTGTKLVKVKKLSFNPDVAIEPGAVASNFNDFPYFGVDNDTTYKLGGLYAFGTSDETKYPWSLSLDYPLSPGQDNAYTIAAIGTAGATDNILLAGWQKGADYGIDYLDTATRYTGAYFTTLLYRLGTAKEKHQTSIEGFQIFLDDELVSGQIVDIDYRRDTAESWTRVAGYGRTNTMSFAEVGSKREIYIPFPIKDIVNMQFKVSFTTSGGNNIKLREIRIQ